MGGTTLRELTGFDLAVFLGARPIREQRERGFCMEEQESVKHNSQLQDYAFLIKSTAH